MSGVTVTYHVACPAGAVAARAEALLLEQVVELPRAVAEAAPVVERTLGEVVSVEPLPGGAAGAERWAVTVAHPLAAVPPDAAVLVTVLFGNSSLQPDVELADFDVAPAVAAAFGGPRHGVRGWRAATGRVSGPLTGTALKPVGLPPVELARLAAAFARAGVDVVKDDHGLGDHPWCRFEDRVKACAAAVAETGLRPDGTRAMYLPVLQGGPAAVLRQAEAAASAGVAGVLVSPAVLGFGVLPELRAGFPDLCLYVHPAWGGAARVAPACLLGRLYRLLGADAVIFPHHGGRFAYDARTCRAIAERAAAAWHGLAPALPSPAGGLSVERVAEAVATYGADVLLLVGGSLFSGGAPADRARAFVDAARESGEGVARVP